MNEWKRMVRSVVRSVVASAAGNRDYRQPVGFSQNYIICEIFCACAQRFWRAYMWIDTQYFRVKGKRFDDNGNGRRDREAF